MSKTVSISPLTRLEGHLAVHTETEVDSRGLHVTSAQCSGEMFRGFENILKGRDPLDAQQITQRICGVCPVSHAIASVRAQEMAYGIKPTNNGRLLQNLILAANYMHSHVMHFYHLAALDFVDITAVLKYRGNSRVLQDLRRWAQSSIDRKDLFPVAPFLPRYESDYISDLEVNWTLLAHYSDALDIRRLAHEMGAVFGAKLPHSTAIVPGGCTEQPTLERILTYRARLKKISDFITDVYLADVVTAASAFPQYWNVGGGNQNHLAFGGFELEQQGDLLFPSGVMINGKWEELNIDHIGEQLRFSRFSGTGELHPSQGQTNPSPHKDGAYSWLKAPRYKGQPMEVGPLSRVMAAYHHPHDQGMRQRLDPVLNKLGATPEMMQSVLGRHLSRALEASWLAEQAFAWLDELTDNGKPAQDFDIPSRGSGYGLTEAPRGALGHWLSLKDFRIDTYQCVVPTTWNCSPRDDNGVPGPVEQALEGVVIADPENPIEPARVVRSYDPCLACAVH